MTAAADSASAPQRIKTYCPLCIARCGAIATIKDGRLLGLEADPEHPTGQALCAKGRAAAEIVESGDRLLHPMKRTLPKGGDDPGWVEIGWDEALDSTASAFRRIADEHGPEAVAFTLASGSTTAVADATGWIRRLMNAFGTPNAVTSVEVCGWARSYATRFTYGVAGLGSAAGGAMPEIDKTGCMVLWGYNPSMTRLTHGTAVAEAVKRGMRLIVVDPRHIGLAAKADEWLRVRPGTDGALALGLANVMIARGWYDRDFVREWSNGPVLVRDDSDAPLVESDLAAGTGDRPLVWDEAMGSPVAWDAAAGAYARPDVRPALEGAFTVTTRDGDVVCRSVFARYAALCADYTTERVAEICWIPADQLERTADLLWHARPSAYYAWNGHEQHANTTQTARAMSLLYALTGCFDQPGGNVLLPAVPSAPITGEDLPAARAMAPAIGRESRPLGPAAHNNAITQDLYSAILDDAPYSVRGLAGFGANPLLAHVDGARGREALAALDFYVHADMFVNPSAALADVLLPVSAPFEREGMKIGFEVSTRAQSHVQLRPALVPPRGECRSDVEIVFALAERLGLGEHFWNGDIDAGQRHQLTPSGITLEALRKAPGGLTVPLETRYAKFRTPGADGIAAGFATPSRRVEFWSESLRSAGYPPLPIFEEPAVGPTAAPDLAKRYPLVLTSAKSAVFCNSQHRGIPALRRRQADPQVELHPDAAAARGIAAGAWVRIASPTGAIRARAKLNARLDPRVVVGQSGWWQACAELDAPAHDPFGPEGTNYNQLIGDAVRDPVSGTASQKAWLCEVSAL